MSTLTKLCELFFGKPYRGDNIANANMNPPPILDVSTLLSEASQQPARLVLALTQTSTDAPTAATPVLNTLGLLDADKVKKVPAWTRNTTGTYHGTLTGAFAGVVIESTKIIADGKYLKIDKVSDNVVRVRTYLVAGTVSGANAALGGTLTDALLASEQISIEVIRATT